MDTDILTESGVPSFGARAAGVTLLAILLTYIFADYLVVEYLKYLSQSDGLLSAPNRTSDEVEAIHKILIGMLNPLLLLVVITLMLKVYFPREDVVQIFKRFGFETSASEKLMVLSFVIGILFVLFFSQVLMRMFPPPEYATKHPANIIASGAFWAQLLFAIIAVTIVPAAEEILFRGVLYKGFSESWNKYVAAVLVSIIFIMVHPDAIGSGYWVTHLSMYIIPVVLVSARMLTGSLVSPIMIHSGFNFGVLFL